MNYLLAQTCPWYAPNCLSGGGGITNPAISKTIGEGGQSAATGIIQLFLTNFITIALGAAGIIAFFMLLAGGLQWVMSGGDKEAVEKARKRITNALIGLAITLSVFAILYIAEALFGISLTKFTIPVIQ